jgi:hypothetical protein
VAQIAQQVEELARRRHALLEFDAFAARAAKAEIATIRASEDEARRGQTVRRRFMQERELRETACEDGPSRGQPLGVVKSAGTFPSVYVPAHLSRHEKSSAHLLLPTSGNTTVSEAKKALLLPAAADAGAAAPRSSSPRRKKKGMGLSSSTSLLPSPNFLGYGWPVYDGQPMVGSPSTRATNFW